MNIEQLIADLIQEEGLKLKAYTCPAGKRTVGVGRNFQDVPFSKAECQALFGTTSISFQNADKILSTKGITKEQAKILLTNDINNCILQLQGQSFWKSVKDDDPRARAIIDLCFNMGINGLLGFKNTLAFIEKKDWPNAAKNLTLSKWYTQVGDRGPKVVSLIDPEFYTRDANKDGKVDNPKPVRKKKV